jgi:hypothetical protein
LKEKAKTWYKRAVGSKEGDWEALSSSFCIDFFSVSKVVNLRNEILTFKQEDSESLATLWERFHLLTNSGPNLALPDHVLLQHFFIGLTQKSKDFLTVASGGSFLRISSKEARKILDKILADKTKEPLVENPLEEESEELEPELIQPSQFLSHRKRK